MAGFIFSISSNEGLDGVKKYVKSGYFSALVPNKIGITVGGNNYTPIIKIPLKHIAFFDNYRDCDMEILQDAGWKIYELDKLKEENDIDDLMTKIVGM